MQHNNTHKTTLSSALFTMLTMALASNKVLVKLLVILSLTGASALSYAQDRTKEIDLIYSKLVSALPAEGKLMVSPYADSLQTFGDDIQAKFNKESDVLGGVALEIETKKGKNPWDAGVFNVVGADIKQGDVIYIAFFAKALELPADGSPALIKNVGVQQGSEPYINVLGKDFTLSEEWQSFALAGTAGVSFDANETQFSMQVATGKQTIAIGAVFVFNLGRGIDASSLPFITQ